jgi:hypothetical protein
MSVKSAGGGWGESDRYLLKTRFDYQSNRNWDCCSNSLLNHRTFVIVFVSVLSHSLFSFLYINLFFSFTGG